MSASKDGVMNIEKYEAITSGVMSTGVCDRLFEEVKALKKVADKANGAALNKEDEELELSAISVLISPFVCCARVVGQERSRHAGQDRNVSPLWIPAKVGSDGRLSPAEGAPPWVSREYLAPHGRGEVFIGEQSEVDAFIRDNEMPVGSDWKEYFDYAVRMLPVKWRESVEKSGYEIREGMADVILDNAVRGASVHVKRVLLYIMSSSDMEGVGALKTMITATGMDSDVENLLSSAAIGKVSRSRHVSHVSDFPLAPSQRQAIIHGLALDDGDVLAVNGPPGTGKTTMLHSLWSSLWVQAAVNGRPAPLIVVSSTNNQAITNVLDSLGKELGVERWLPGVSSLGAFLANKDKGRPSGYFWQDIWEGMHSDIENADYILQAQPIYLSNANEFFERHGIERPDTLSGVIEALRQMLFRGVGLLDRMYEMCEEFASCKERVAAVGDIAARTSEITDELTQVRDKIGDVSAFERAWASHIANESWVLALLSFLPPIRNKQRAMDAVCLAEFPIIRGVIKKMEFPRDRQRLGQEVIKFRKQLKNKAFSLTSEQDELAKLDAKMKSLSDQLQDELLALELRHNREPSLWDPSQISNMFSDSSPAMLFDTTIRRLMFEVAVHYWEGKWLQDVGSLKTINNRGTTRALWTRRAMLTPCMVTTMQSGPKFFQSWQHDQKIALPDYRAIDCLVVDEAGQISPEVSGAMFALSKKVVAVGDCAQIQPVWNIPAYLDVANATSSGLNDFSRIKAAGQTASSGSVMRAAQIASRFTLGPEYPRGLFLSEHRRCADPIIGYCNELAYNGKIVPKRSRPWVRDDFPWNHFGYAHIDGEDVQPSTGSRMNEVEAESIAEWILQEKDRILTYYGKTDLSACIGIVTPFAAQGRRIRQALAARNLRIEKCGTVHGLQGAERPLVLFSSVYSTRGPGSGAGFFFDSGPEMLNVAVSRAKDGFFVFGDMGIFSQQGSSPSALLARKMFASEDNEIPVKVVRPELRDSRPEEYIKVVMGLEEHLILLASAFEDARQSIVIVSPYVTDRAVVQYKTAGGRWAQGIPGKIRDCVARGVGVTVYVDKGKLVPDKSEAAIAAIKNAGADVRFVRNTHAKPLYVDDELFVEGSFNWFSGERIDGRYKQFEMSTSYKVRGGKDPLVPYISRSIKELESLRVE